MICECCGKEIEGEWRKDRASRKKPLRFCSIPCSRSREQTEESRIKKSVTLHRVHGTEYKACSLCGVRLGWKNKSGFCTGCKPPAKTRYENLKVFRKKRKEDLIAYKGGRCEICGYNTCTAALEFHHRDPTVKEFSIGSKRGFQKRTWEEEIKEVNKCDLLCSNCHKTLHFNRPPSH